VAFTAAAFFLAGFGYLAVARKSKTGTISRKPRRGETRCTRTAENIDSVEEMDVSVICILRGGTCPLHIASAEAASVAGQVYGAALHHQTGLTVCVMCMYMVLRDLCSLLWTPPAYMLAA